MIGYSLIETPPTVRVIAELRAVLHYGKINETESTLAPQYGQNAIAQADFRLALEARYYAVLCVQFFFV